MSRGTEGTERSLRQYQRHESIRLNKETGRNIVIVDSKRKMGMRRKWQRAINIVAQGIHRSSTLHMARNAADVIR